MRSNNQVHQLGNRMVAGVKGEREWSVRVRCGSMMTKRARTRGALDMHNLGDMVGRWHGTRHATWGGG